MSSAEAELRVVAAAARAGIDAGALVRRVGGAHQLLHASAKRLDALGVAPGLAHELAAARREDIAAYTADLAARGILCIARSDPGYPSPLRELHDPPLAVFAMGTGAGPPLALPGRALGIVGARRAGAPALALARRLAAYAAGAGVCVVSGLALGVDAAGHLGALESDGATIAVLGCGPDVAYPRTNAGLYRRVAREWARPVGVRARHAARTVAVPGAKPPDRRALRCRPRGRGAGPLRRAHHRRPCARPRPRRAGRARLGGIPRRGRHERPAEGRSGDDRERGRSRGVAGPRPALAGCASGARTPRSSRRLRRGPAHIEELAERLGQPAHELAAALSRLELDGWIGRDESGRYLAIRGTGSPGRG